MTLTNNTNAISARKALGIALLCSAGWLAMGTANAATAPAPAADADALSEIVVTGSRRVDRSVADSPSPIDVFTPEDLAHQAGGDTNDLLRQLVPSFNVARFSISDGSTFVRPPTLRGLPPDETLVLINGKRFHRSALVQIGANGLTQGAQGPDLAQIPAIAIKQLEVLRDGAAAQYGSDAIAGVMNFTLKDSADQGTVVAQWGQTYAGDGGSAHIQANSGLPLGDRGFVNISAEYVKNDPTSRGTQRPDAAALAAQGLTIPNPAQRFGDPAVEAERLFINSGVDLGDNSKIYLFGNFGHSYAKESFNYRNPTTVSWLITPITLDSGATFKWNSVFPNGFTPWFYGDILDSSITGGYKTTLKSGLMIDASASYGKDELRYSIRNTVNPSLGPSSPHQFYVGTQIQEETNLNLDLTYPVNISWLASPLTLAGGGEYRRETYTIKSGDVASYQAGKYYTYGMPIGSNGYPGFTATDAGQYPRGNYAFYADAEADIIKNLSAGVALRYEDFDDFGDTTNWKIFGRYQLTDWVAVRSSINTGFRAPTPGQSHISSTQTTFKAGSPEPIVLGTFPVDSVVAQYYGAKTLKPETSFNIAGGLVFDLPGGVNLTVDYYNIKVEDRVGITSDFTVSAADQTRLAALGVVGANTLGNVNYFANAFDTRSQGVDIVANKTFEVYDGDLHLTAAANINHTDVTKYDASVIDANRKADIENGLPHYRVNLTATYDIGAFSFMYRGSYYGAWQDNSSAGQHYDPNWIFDAEIAYKVTEDLTATVGAQNLFDTYPQKNRSAGRLNYGDQYPDTSPFGYDGGMYYFRMAYKF
ncbi:iron complex outermembrane receptor protein [Nitrospirillum amazonense]|uniref:Iron complex outermembrane receptor protein n=1 Tax=Nitrospirillum amazonense TaxID=28077 RepID=A0A560FBP5_9PROT|nr:TonB-dependent receptor [Nitrospirillum amazonense]TWB19033.1 iron complex outermembrane receptor protein [Nitrospirillum amazonense]